MKPIRFFLLLITMLSTPLISFSQDVTITQIARNNVTTFSVEKETFVGNGWDRIMNQIQKSDFVLIGEDHLTNEIPFFVSAVTAKVKFDNFFCEIDPYSAKIIESKIKTLNGNSLRRFRDDFGEVFSFFAFEPEFQLLEHLVKANTSIYGIDQVLMNADRLICHDLKNTTKNENAKKIYESIKEKSKSSFAGFLKDQNKPMYLLTDDFDKQISELLSLKLSPEERLKIEDVKLSSKIYKEQNHHLRIQLMKSNLMNVYPQWRNKKNLFKFGAIHVSKSESFFKIFDMGNLVNNVADGAFKDSLHIMIVGKSGTQASPFKGFPERAIEEDSYILKALKPLFNAVDGEKWHCFDMLPLQKALEAGDIVVKDITLSRIIKGYDIVVIIPKVTASKFPKTE